MNNNWRRKSKARRSENLLPGEIHGRLTVVEKLRVVRNLVEHQDMKMYDALCNQFRIHEESEWDTLIDWKAARLEIIDRAIEEAEHP